MKSKISCVLKVADNERKNVNFPACPLSSSLEPDYIRTVYNFQKIDPTKDGWGDIEIDVTVKEPIPMQKPINTYTRFAPVGITVGPADAADEADADTGMSAYYSENSETGPPPPLTQVNMENAAVGN